MDIKIKNLNDVQRMIDSISADVDDILNLLTLQRQAISASVKRLLKAEIFKPVSTEPHRVSSFDLPSEVKVKNGAKNLQQHYYLLEELFDREETLKNLITAVNLQFPDDLNTPSILESLQALVTRVQSSEQDIIVFLTEVAEATVPPSFAQYVSAVSAELASVLNIQETDYAVSYLLSTYQSALLYTAYIELKHLETAQRKALPTTYVTLSWCVGSNDVPAEVRLNIAYAWQTAEELFDSSVASVSSVADATANVLNMLKAEGILLLNNIDNTAPSDGSIDLTAMNLSDKIAELSVTPMEITVTFTRLPRSVNLTSLQAEVYMGLQRLIGTTKADVATTNKSITLSLINGVTDPVSITPQTVEYFTKVWGLSAVQLDKIGAILS